ncbi:hypothetical protein BDV18DRAFT_141609 [Aspergillus unguis]
MDKHTDRDKSEYTAVPITLLDATVVNTPILFRMGIVVNAPLDLDKLRESWYLTLKARPIMQARVHRSTTAPSGLEYHVLTPKAMETYLDKQAKADDHLKEFLCVDESHRPVADYFAGLKERPHGEIVVSDKSPDEKHFTAINALDSFDECLEKGRPLLTIQVTRFSDATAINVSFSHVLGDIFTIKTLLRGWESTLHGQIPPPFEDLGRDPFEAYGPGGELVGEATSDSSPLPPGWRFFNFLDKIRFMYYYLWDFYITRPETKLQQKYIFIPESKMQSLVEQARADVQQNETVTRSNVLHAWLLKQLHLRLHPEKWTTSLTVVSTRHRPPTGMVPQDKGTDFPTHNWYNATMATALPPLRVRDIASMSLGELALHIKQGIRAGSSPENLRRLLAYTLNNSLWRAPSPRMLMFGPPDHSWSGVTDWRLAKLHDLDFSPAREDTGSEKKKVAVEAFTCNIVSGFSLRDRWSFMGEAGGGVWITGSAGEKQWNDPEGLGRYRHVNSQGCISK